MLCCAKWHRPLILATLETHVGGLQTGGLPWRQGEFNINLDNLVRKKKHPYLRRPWVNENNLHE